MNGSVLLWTDTSKGGEHKRRLDENGVFDFEDADFIVRAYNLHDEFVEAAEVTIEWLVLKHGEPPTDPAKTDQYHRLIMRLRNALSLTKAEGR